MQCFFSVRAVCTARIRTGVGSHYPYVRAVKTARTYGRKKHARTYGPYGPYVRVVCTGLYFPAKIALDSRISHTQFPNLSRDDIPRISTDSTAGGTTSARTAAAWKTPIPLGSPMFPLFLFYETTTTTNVGTVILGPSTYCITLWNFWLHCWIDSFW